MKIEMRDGNIKQQNIHVLASIFNYSSVHTNLDKSVKVVLRDMACFEYKINIYTMYIYLKPCRRYMPITL